MTLGEKLRTARLEAGLSQRQLCGDTITRNMLSQIENGTANPSMATLSYLAARLQKPVSYFLDASAIHSPNRELIEAAHRALDAGDGAAAAAALSQYVHPDPLFDAQAQLLSRLATLHQAEDALQSGQAPYAAELLQQNAPYEDGYCARDLERRRLLLLVRAVPRLRREICSALPSLDEELLLRARLALDLGEQDRCAAFLEAAQDQEDASWNFLRAELHLTRGQYAAAAQCYHKAEIVFPEKCAPRLERCYRELGDFRQAYAYACRQR